MGNFLGGPEANLLVGKVTYIDVYSITKEGLVSVVELPIYGAWSTNARLAYAFKFLTILTGRLLVMKLFRMPNEDQDFLLVLTEKQKMFVIRWNPAIEQCETVTNGEVLDHLGQGDASRIGIVDPLARCIGFHHLQHVFKVVPADSKGDCRAFNVRLHHDNIIDIAFLHGYPKPTIAMLYKESDTAHIVTFEINVAEEDFSEYRWKISSLDATAEKLVPIPKPLGGLLVIGCHSISYMTENGASINQPMDPTVIKAVGLIDADGSRLLLGDHKGQLLLLRLVLENGNTVKQLALQPLGEVSVPSSISYLDNGYVFVGSDQGDTQLIKLETTPNPKTGSHIVVVQRYPHLGPITDFCIVKGMGYLRQGQGQVVTCSGVGKDGSLRVIRNGIGITEQASAELPGIKAMFSLRRHFDDEYHAYLVQSFTSETRTLELVGAFDMAEASLPAIDPSSPTLHAANVVADQIVQVTADGVRLMDCTSMTGKTVWTPPHEFRVSVAAGNSSQILLATTGGNVVFLEINGPMSVKETAVKFDNEISCLDCSPLARGSKENCMVLPEENARIAAVGFWADINKSPVVKILELPSLRTLYTAELGGDVMARSVLLVTLEGSNYLLVGLGDGYLLTYELKLEVAIEAVAANLDESNQKMSSIVGEGRRLNVGSQPANLSIFRSRGANHVFAACDRPTVVYAASGVGKLLLSNVNLQEVTRVCGFNTEAFPDCLAIALENSFQLGAVDEIQKLHIHTVQLGDQPRRIAHIESARAFAVVTESAQIDDDGRDVLKYNVNLVHDSTYDPLSQFELDKFEVASSITTARFKGIGVDSETEYLLLGTTLELMDEEDPKAGRILVFTVTENRLTLVTEQKVSGATYSLCPFDGKIIAGVNSLVIVYSLQEDAGGTIHLVKEDLHHGHIIAYRIQARGNFILVGDLMRSVTLLTWKPVGNNRLEEVARDYDNAWTMAIEMLDDDVYVMSEHSKHLFTLRRNSYATTENERMRLERVGFFHIGAMINRIMHGSLVMQMPDGENAAAKTLIFGTADGMIGVIATLKPDAYAFFLELQKAMVLVSPGVGGLDHTKWREMGVETPTKTAVAKNYLDGDLIERFLDLNSERKKRVSSIVDVSVDELVRRVEEMQRLHGAG